MQRSLSLPLSLATLPLPLTDSLCQLLNASLDVSLSLTRSAHLTTNTYPLRTPAAAVQSGHFGIRELRHCPLRLLLRGLLLLTSYLPDL